jgi:uncharacterized Zn-finger protein
MSTSTPRKSNEPVETIAVSDTTVACDGGAGSGPSPLGHPRVFLTMDKNNTIDCPYCGRRFVLKSHA